MCAEIESGCFTALVLIRLLQFLFPVLRVCLILRKKFNKKKLQFSEFEFILDLVF